MGADDLGALGFVAIEPCQRGVEGVQFGLKGCRRSSETMPTLVRSLGQRDQPDPIALAHQVVGRQAAGVLVPGPPGQVVRPVCRGSIGWSMRNQTALTSWRIGRARSSCFLRARIGHWRRRSSGKPLRTSPSSPGNADGVVRVAIAERQPRSPRIRRRSRLPPARALRANPFSKRPRSI